MILYLLYLLHFHLPSSFRVDILVYLFFVSLISSPASCTIPFFLCEVPTLMIDSDCPSILKSNMQARMQVLFLCVCAIPFLSFASSQFAYWLKELLEVQISLCTAHLWIFFIAFPIHFWKSSIAVVTNLISHGIICSVTLLSYLPSSCTNSA